MEEKSSSDNTKFKWPRYPRAAAGIQVNHCKSLTCRNFGVPTGKAQPAFKCLLCGESFPMHSNLAIAEELLFISDYLEPMAPRCLTLDWAGQEHVGEGQCTKYGVTRFGTPRYKCKTCKKVFAFGGAPDKGQHHTPQPGHIPQAGQLGRRPRSDNGVGHLAKAPLRPLRCPSAITRRPPSNLRGRGPSIKNSASGLNNFI